VSCNSSVQQLEQSVAIDTSAETNMGLKKLTVENLGQDVIRDLAVLNPCYLPLLEDSSYYHIGFGKIGFTYNELFNSRLSLNHPYRNRYIVGDFNSMDVEYNSRGIKEKLPNIWNLTDFQKVPRNLLDYLEKAVGSQEFRELFYSNLDTFGANQTKMLNFFNQVWSFKTDPIETNYNSIGNTLYAAGQTLCLCEAYEDTLILVARFAVSSKRLDISIKKSEDGSSYRSHFQLLPVDNYRHYYASLNTISSRNWETQRKYTFYDSLHDLELGSINKDITFYRGRVELPNFLLIKPTVEYSRAMPGNGVHEVALRELARGMLGSPNSIGCIRISDFGSKFCRWWVPQDANFFILYQEDKYFGFVDSSGHSISAFRSSKDSDKFRKWMIDNYPDESESMGITSFGSPYNEKLLRAYKMYKSEYLSN